MSDYFIRPYTQSDREDIRRIAADNAYLGETVENIMDDRNFFNDILMEPYLTEKESIGFVAVFDGKVQGYIVGASDSQKFRKKKLKHLFSVFMKIFFLRYRTGMKTAKYIYNRLLSKLRDENRESDLSDYPAHLHIDTDRTVRGKGVGTALMSAYMEKLKAEGIPGVHLSTTNFNIAAIRMYKKLGFAILDSHKSTEYGKSPEYNALQKVVMVKKL